MGACGLFWACAANGSFEPVADITQGMLFPVMAKGNEKARRMELRRANGTRRLRDLPEVSLTRGPESLTAHACFRCNKSWKMEPSESGHVCPECGKFVDVMGRSFKAPRKSDCEQWEKIKRLWEAGFRFHSYRSYPEAEPLPERLRDVEDFIARNPNHPFRTRQA
jgi:predicted RNA-binding Zn-ribbon protein involved in translation (DUF1610 family)